jgi:hypothetical protein
MHHTSSSRRPTVIWTLAVAFIASAFSIAWPGVPAGWAAFSLQQAVDEASPGDTVWVEPGDYLRTLLVNKAITIRPSGPAGSVRLASAEASLATLEGIVFDGALGDWEGVLALAGPSATFADCRFTGKMQGLQVQTGSGTVLLRDCAFDGLFQAITLEPGPGSLLLERVEASGISIGLALHDTLICPPGGIRTPAERCAAGDCGEVRVIDSRFTGGEVQIDLPGVIRFEARGSVFEVAKLALRARGARIELEDCVISGVTQSGTGLILHSVSGYLRRCEVRSWNTAIEVGDGDCSYYSDLVVGGSLDVTNDIDNTRVCLRLLQQEPIQAEANFWGSVSCAGILAAIQGQTVTTITDVDHGLLYFCSTAVERSTWGRVKTRYPAPDGRIAR